MYFGYTYEIGMRPVNQDALLVRSCLLSKGELTMALVCDGMGGEESGEFASYFCINAFDVWFDRVLIPTFTGENGSFYKRGRAVQSKGIALFRQINDELFLYMRKHGEKTGTTVAVLILYRDEYYLFHIGDSRIYFLDSILGKMWIHSKTKDHAKGHVLLRCLGLNREYKPDYQFGKTICKYFLLCTDGFWHRYNSDMWKICFDIKKLTGSLQVNKRINELAKDNYKNGETDNASAVLVVNSNEKERSL